jgi:putative transcriptional regulator
MPESRALSFLLVLVLATLCGWSPAVLAEENGRGVLLVAAPGHGGEAFAESVLLLKRHARGGTVGVVINRPTETRVDAIFPGGRAPDTLAERVYAGGPSDPEQLVFLVRTRSHSPSNALHVFDRVFLAHDLELLKNILHHPVPLAGLRVFRGHARWARGELEAEIARGAWYLVEADADGLFTDDPATLWQRLVQQIEKQGVRAPGRDRSSTAAPATARS